MLKNPAQHGHADLLCVVVAREFGEAGDQFVADGEAIECRIRRKQAAVVGRDFQVRVAAIHRFKQGDEINPARLRVVGVNMDGGGFDGALRQQAPAFGKGDEQQAVNQLLRVRYQVSKGNAGVEMVQTQDELLPQRFVVLVQRLGDVTLSQGVGFEQVLRGVAEQVAGAQQADEAGVARGLQQLGSCPGLIHSAAIAEGVQAYLIAVADQYKLAAGQVVGVFPGLLHRAFVAARHERFKVAGFGALELKRRDDLLLSMNEGAQTGIDRAGGCLGLQIKRPGVAVKKLVAQHIDEKEF